VGQSGGERDGGGGGPVMLSLKPKLTGFQGGAWQISLATSSDAIKLMNRGI